MQLCHNDIKALEKRVSTESQKAKDLAAGFEKVKKAMEAEKKAYCVDLKKSIDAYFLENPNLTPELKLILKDYSTGLDQLQKVYDESTKHIQDVACNALGHLPTKLDNYYKKNIKLAEKQVEGSIDKLKYFEFDRILYTQRGLLHYLNA